MRRKIASSRRLKSKMRRNLLSLRPVKPRGPALRVSFPRKNTTLSLFLPLVREGRCWNEERGKERKEKKQSVGQREWMEEGTRHFSVRHPALSGLPLRVWIKGRAPFALPCVCACVCVTRNARISLQWKEQRVGGVAISRKASSATKLERRVYE